VDADPPAAVVAELRLGGGPNYCTCRRPLLASYRLFSGAEAGGITGKCKRPVGALRVVAGDPSASATEAAAAIQ